MAGAHAVGPHRPHQLQILHHSLHRHAQSEGSVFLMPVEPLQPQGLPVQQDPVSLDPDFPEPDPVDPVVRRLPVQLQHSLHCIKHRRIRRPFHCVFAWNPKRQCSRPVGGQLRLNRSCHPILGQLRPSLCRLPVDSHRHRPSQRFSRQVVDADLRVRLPALLRLPRRHMAPGDVGRSQLFCQHRPVNPAVGVIVVGNVQGGILPKPVVRLDPQGMLSPGNVQRQPLESRVCAVVLRQQCIVQVYGRPEADAAQPDPHVSSADDFLLIDSASPVVSQRGMRLPHPGHNHLLRLLQPAGVRRGKSPNRRAFPAFPDFMGPKNSLHFRQPRFPGPPTVTPRLILHRSRQKEKPQIIFARRTNGIVWAYRGDCPPGTTPAASRDDCPPPVRPLRHPGITVPRGTHSGFIPILYVHFPGWG